ncbi:hypothetical protein AG1IA_04126 [Rhizoctonia solani AG-1 IA]|uniref:Uncharacterized protein n=1 Tax=Thanatephorus cucumeris (strain AG1-IA) TaxID=983506 RepID=L8WZR2_THACA|nr:hypothetical protein AG1IA_04126 [Rhizoctonia solani AG-1 IA]
MAQVHPQPWKNCAQPTRFFVLFLTPPNRYATSAVYMNAVTPAPVHSTWTIPKAPHNSHPIPMYSIYSLASSTLLLIFSHSLCLQPCVEHHHLLFFKIFVTREQPFSSFLSYPRFCCPNPRNQLVNRSKSNLTRQGLHSRILHPCLVASSQALRPGTAPRSLLQSTPRSGLITRSSPSSSSAPSTRFRATNQLIAVPPSAMQGGSSPVCHKQIAVSSVYRVQ